ncbi:iron chelate uptake ABC transporter family permease subunit [bacterium]|nr:iron chelate uptake ABC transporter family permease subunit [bacterium]
MHFADGQIPVAYRRYLGRKRLAIAMGLVALAGLLVAAVGSGAVDLAAGDVVRSLLRRETPAQVEAIVWNIRLPQALTAIVAGAGLALSGAVMQAVLRNPLGSPFTLGVAQAAAFGAALAVMVLGGGAATSSGPAGTVMPGALTASAFTWSAISSLVIVLLARVRGTTPEVMVLAGVALGALFTAGTMFLQYFADDTQLAAMVFWTFGDTARASWGEVGLLAGATAAVWIVFQAGSWDYNAIDAGDETARSLGVAVGRVRWLGMLLAALLTAVIIAHLGVIGFVGLVAPHMARRIVGADHRFLLPATLVLGAILLLAADTVARLLLAPRVLPVSVLTAFLGAPAFLALILRRRRP